jgi:hypothetical protein
MLPFVVQEDQPVMVRHALLKDGSDLLSVLNLGADPLDGFTIRSGRRFNSLQSLGCEGEWSHEPFEVVDQFNYKIFCNLKTYEPRIIKIEFPQN